MGITDQKDYGLAALRICGHLAPKFGEAVEGGRPHVQTSRPRRPAAVRRQAGSHRL